jgi:hypothetical protein
LQATGPFALEAAAAPAAAEPPARVYRVGVISANVLGKSQPLNGHNWHFGQYLHPVCDLAAMKKRYPCRLVRKVKQITSKRRNTNPR